jgi:hypothetical protein
LFCSIGGFLYDRSCPVGSGMLALKLLYLTFIFIRIW